MTERLGEIVSFGDYIFPENSVEQFNDNFSNLVPATTRLVGLDGGWREDGSGPAPSSIGQVSVQFILFASENNLDELRDMMRKPTGAGLQRLVFKPTTGVERYCYASINYISDSRRAGLDECALPVRITFQVPYPRWLNDEYQSWRLGDGASLGQAGLVIGSNPFLITSPFGTTVTATVTNKGNAPALCWVSMMTSNFAFTPTLSRAAAGYTTLSWTYTDTVLSNSELIVDGIHQMVTVDEVNAWANLIYDDPALLWLAPGDNEITIDFASTANQVETRLYFSHTWY